MSAVDTAWLRMDSPTNQMMIIGVMMFDGPTDVERFKRTIGARLLRYARFRQRVVQDATGAYWIDDDNFDLDNHVACMNLASPGDKAALQGLVATLAAQALDHNKPLWSMTVIENYSDSGRTGSALITRIHHCIADGIALIGVLGALTDSTPDADESGIEPEALRRARERREKKKAAAPADLFGGLVAPVAAAANRALGASSGLWEMSQEALANPEKIAEVAKVAADVTTELAALALMPSDSATSLKGKPGTVKRVAWSEPLPLADVKAVCKVLGVSVNDILLSSCAGAIRDYLESKGEATDAVEVAGMVPVNLRAPGDEHRLGNHFGLVLLSLPVGIAHPFVRLYEVKRRMDALKGSWQAMISMGILGTVGFLPRAMQKQVLDLFSAKASAVMTNVPGPQIPLYIAGRRLVQQMFWVPQSGDIGVGISILSYSGQVQFGLITDKKFVAEPARIVERFAREFDKLVYYLLIEGAAPADQARVPPSAPVRKPRAAPAANPPAQGKRAARPAPARSRRSAPQAQPAKA
ncbi:MAG: wax ester/triacylglycerol synthase family O-acyltransferase [Burkholderiales bacterium]|nr:wax ester/triacylglycerol synthase family O-acyltransferase [Burkholderiales bacterium]